MRHLHLQPAPFHRIGGTQDGVGGVENRIHGPWNSESAGRLSIPLAPSRRRCGITLTRRERGLAAPACPPSPVACLHGEPDPLAARAEPGPPSRPVRACGTANRIRVHRDEPQRSPLSACYAGRRSFCHAPITAALSHIHYIRRGGAGLELTAELAPPSAQRSSSPSPPARGYSI